MQYFSAQAVNGVQAARIWGANISSYYLNVWFMGIEGWTTLSLLIHKVDNAWRKAILLRELTQHSFIFLFQGS